MGGTVNSRIGLSYRPARLNSVGRNDNPMLESTIFPIQGTMNLATGVSGISFTIGKFVSRKIVQLLHIILR